MEQMTLQLTGTAALLMHNNISVDPLDPRTKVLKDYTGKRKKTDDDHLKIRRIEWELGLYYDPEVGPYIPGVNVEIMLRDAGKLTKDGTNVTRAVVVAAEKLPLKYEGPRGDNGQGVQDLWEANYKDVRVAGNQANSIIRCRPRFPGPGDRGGPWSLTVPIFLEESILDPRELHRISVSAGLMIGLGDYRPRFGRFTVERAD